MYITMITIASSYMQCYDSSFIVSETILYSHYITHTLYRLYAKKSHIFNVHILYPIILDPVYNHIHIYVTHYPTPFIQCVPCFYM